MHYNYLLLSFGKGELLAKWYMLIQMPGQKYNKHLTISKNERQFRHLRSRLKPAICETGISISYSQALFVFQEVDQCH